MYINTMFYNCYVFTMLTLLNIVCIYIITAYLIPIPYLINIK